MVKAIEEGLIKILINLYALYIKYLDRCQDNKLLYKTVKYPRLTLILRITIILL